MQGRIHQWLGRSVAVVAVCGACVAARGQQDGGMPPAAPPAQYHAASDSVPANDPLATRVAELEKALKKLEDKAKEDKKKAESAPSVKVIGRLQYDGAAFSQNPASIAAAGDMKNGTEFRRARIGVMGEAFQVIDYNC
jgi:hypothetical protein